MKCNRESSDSIDFKAFIDALPEASDEELSMLLKMIKRSYNHLPDEGQWTGFDVGRLLGVILNATLTEQIERVLPGDGTPLGILKKLQADAFEAGVAHAQTQR